MARKPVRKTPPAGGPRLIFVNRVFWPNEAATAQLLDDVATGVARRGVPVWVISSAEPLHQRPETRGAVRVERVRRWFPRQKGLAARALNYATFWLGAFYHLLRLARRGDVVVAMTDPPLLAFAAAQVARLRGARVWHWCQDIYPELALVLGAPPVTRSLLRALVSRRDRVWRSAEGCVALGNDMARHLQRSGVRQVTVLPNWAPRGVVATDGSEVRRHWHLDRTFVVAYSGNLGRAHELQVLLTLASQLRDESRLRFIFIGDGAQRVPLQEEARRLDLKYVRFFPPQPRELLAAVLAVADLHVVTMREPCVGLVWPSKFYGIVAAERPLLFIGPPEAEVATIIRKRGLGATFQASEIAAMGRFIQELVASPERQQSLRSRVRDAHRDFNGLEQAIGHWTQVLHGREYSSSAYDATTHAI